MMQTDQMTQPNQTVAQSEEKKPSLYLSVELLRRVKSEAALQGVSIKQFVTDALEEKLGNQK